MEAARILWSQRFSANRMFWIRRIWDFCRCENTTRMKWCAIQDPPTRPIVVKYHIDDAVGKVREGTTTLSLYDASPATFATRQ